MTKFARILVIMDHQNLIRQIESIGLSEKSAMIYICLIELGGAYPSQISDLTKINRSTVYKLLIDLSVKGLVSDIRKGKKLYYQAEKIDRLKKFVEMRYRISKEALSNIESVIPVLQDLSINRPNKPKVRYYENREGIMSIYDDMVEENQYEMVAFSNASSFKNYLKKDELDDFIVRKNINNITTRGIVPDSEENRKFHEIFSGKVNSEIIPKIKFIKPELFPYDAELTVYGKSKLAITKLQDDKLIGIVIDDSLIHNMIRSIFDMLWNSNMVSE